MIGSIFSVVAIGGLAIMGFGVLLIVQSVSRNESVRLGVLLTIAGLLIAFLFFVINAGMVEVKADEVAVVFNTFSGDLQDEPLAPGLHVIIPGIQDATIYSVAQQEYTVSGSPEEGAVRGNDAVVALTQDGQRVEIDATMLFRINPADAEIVHQDWGNRYVNGLIRPALRNQVRAALTSFRVEQIYGAEHGELEQVIEQGVRDLIEPKGFQLTNVLIRNISFSDEYVASIERKQVAQQEAQEAEFRVQQRKQEAEQARQAAQGRRDAAIIEAEGEAEALRLINEQLAANPALIQWRYIEQLGDNVGLIIIPSNSPFLFDMESLTQQMGITVPQPSTSSTETSNGASDSTNEN
jgi:regulator of protease activity HflC (stomatin/prohibitin superfamily)